MMIFAMFRVLNSGRSEKIEFEEQDLKESLFPVADSKEIENPENPWARITVRGENKNKTRDLSRVIMILIDKRVKRSPRELRINIVSFFLQNIQVTLLI